MTRATRPTPHKISDAPVRLQGFNPDPERKSLLSAVAQLIYIGPLDSGQRSRIALHTS